MNAKVFHVFYDGYVIFCGDTHYVAEPADPDEPFLQLRSVSLAVVVAALDDIAAHTVGCPIWLEPLIRGESDFFDLDVVFGMTKA